MSNTVPLSLELCQSIAELSLEHRTGVVNVGSQSADTIKLDFSSCSGRKQNVSTDLSQRPLLLLLQPPAVRHQACAHCPSVLLVRFSATPRMMERAVSLNRELGIPNTEKLFNGRPPTAALDSCYDASPRSLAIALNTASAASCISMPLGQGRWNVSLPETPWDGRSASDRGEFGRGAPFTCRLVSA